MCGHRAGSCPAWGQWGKGQGDPQQHSTAHPDLAAGCPMQHLPGVLFGAWPLESHSPAPGFANPSHKVCNELLWFLIRHQLAARLGVHGWGAVGVSLSSFRAQGQKMGRGGGGGHFSAACRLHWTEQHLLSPSSSAAPRNEPKPWDLGHPEGLISNPTCRKFCLLSVLLDPDLGDEQQHTVPGS